MKRSLTRSMAGSLGKLAGFAMKSRGFRRRSDGDVALNRFTTYCVAPVWIGASLLDYFWHRRTKIETTSGIGESLTHTLMMLEGGPPVIAPLFLEVNSGVLAGMIAFSILHEVTVLWDLQFTAPRRTIPAGEQVTHTFLEGPPFLVTAAAIVTHWEQFLALFGRGRQRPRFEIRLRRPFLSPAALITFFAALGLFGVLPHLGELRRCMQAMQEGRIGQDTPACLPEVFPA